MEYFRAFTSQIWQTLLSGARACRGYSVLKESAAGRALAPPPATPLKQGAIGRRATPATKNIAKLLGGLVEEIPEGRQILVLADFLEGGDFLGELVGVVLGRLD